MTFKTCDDSMPASTFFSLKEDGDAAVIVFLGEPIPREEDFRGKPRVRAYFPIFTKEGLQVWGLGARLYRTIRDNWDKYQDKAFTVTRAGKSGSTDTTYGFKEKPINVASKREIDAITPKMIKDMLTDVMTHESSDDGGDEPPI